MLTLKDPKKAAKIPVYDLPGRIEYLRDSFYFHKYHLIGVQEANASISAVWSSAKMTRIAQGGPKNHKVV